jgi:deazaflavin-dependent oxidoreductase (nitroreductase family)
MSTNAMATPRIPRVVSILNPLIRRFLGVGLPFGPNVLLTVRGRTSGLPRTFPVAILEYDGRRFVQSPFGEVNWVRNLRADGAAVLAKGGSREEVSAVELPPEMGGPILRASFKRYLDSPLGRVALTRFFNLSRQSSLGDYVDVARRHPMFELLQTRQNARASVS